MDAQTITWWDKIMSPVPWLPWIPVILLGVGVVLWALDRWVFRTFNIPPELKRNNIAVALVVCTVILSVVLIFNRAAFGATTAYDGHFRRWAVQWFGADLDWRTFKAQAMTESALRPRVCSHVGACGLMQIMPGTARQLGIDPFRPRQAIMGGIRYDRQLWNQWSAPRPPGERWALTAVSYNAGLGNALRFQRAAIATGECDANRYPCILPHIWKEPRQYVERIGRWCTRFRGVRCYQPPLFTTAGGS